MSLIQGALVILYLVLRTVIASPLVVDGGWGPWEVDPEVDCCMYGGYERVRRYCTNPLPEQGGQKCTRDDTTTGDFESRWRSCTCQCTPACDPDPEPTSFCAINTGAAAHCLCNWGLIVPHNADPNGIVRCVQAPASVDPEAAASNASSGYSGDYIEPDTKDILYNVQYATIGWLLAWIIAIMTIYFVMCAYGPGRMIHLQEEITMFVVYALIVSLAEKTTIDVELCRVVSIFLHYLFLCTMTFFCLEALQTYSLVTYVVPKRGIFHGVINLAMGYAFPLIPVVFSVGFLWDYYGTNGRHCWCNWWSEQSWAFFVPIGFLAFVCAIISEAQGQGSYQSLPDSDPTQMHAAKMSQKLLIPIMGLTMVSYIFGLLAVDLQNLVLYCLFAICNFVLGPLIFLGHAVADPKLYEMLAKIFPCIGEKKEPEKPRAMSGSVYPPPPPRTADDVALPPTMPEPPQQQRRPSNNKNNDTDWNDVYKWISDGKEDNVADAQNVLFK